MTPDDRTLESLLDSVARGDAVDWADAEARAGSEDERVRLSALREVARVAEFHRGLQRDVMPGPGGQQVERWGELLLLERVGAGASGDVYRAWDLALQREVALKLLRPREGAQQGDLLEEARALARVRDPHVVTVHGAGEHDGRVGLWMEFLHGPTLEDEIARRGALPADEVARLGAQLARAVEAVHAAGALHRDVKPANVILERDGRAVLMDFGLGQRQGGSRSDPAPFSGTPMYMSPQRLAGAPATAADDVYALGGTLRCAVTGSPPFPARTLEELRVLAAAGPPERLRVLRPDVPEALARAIEHAMDPRPAARFESAAALASALEAAPGATPRASQPRRRAGSLLALAAALGAVTLLALILRLGRHDERAPRPAGSTAVTTPTLPASDAYDVTASFVRRGPGSEVRLGPGDRVAPGDRLSLEFRATRPVWVYVLDADERGECYLLFPQPVFDRANPLPGDTTVVLPGTRLGLENAWTVTSRGGREHFLVVASPERVPELEAEVAHLPAPVPGRPIQYARVEPATVERLRGVGGLNEVPSAAPDPGPAAIFARVTALMGRERGVRGTWVRQITLENPLR